MARMSSLHDLVRQNLTIPAVPVVAARLIACLDDPQVDLQAVAGTIEDDPALVAVMLKHANSAAFGLPRRLATATEALQFLGVDTVRAMAIATAVQQSCSAVPEDKVAMVWLLSHHTANAATVFARLLGQPSGLYATSGMLHAVGMLAVKCQDVVS